MQILGVEQRHEFGDATAWLLWVTPRRGGVSLQMASVGWSAISGHFVRKLNVGLCDQFISRALRELCSAEGHIYRRQGSGRGFMDHVVVISKHSKDARRQRDLAPVSARRQHFLRSGFS
jgi:hypothetical protein